VSIAQVDKESFGEKKLWWSCHPLGRFFFVFLAQKKKYNTVEKIIMNLTYFHASAISFQF
jgi:hypothetical protein